MADEKHDKPDHDTGIDGSIFGQRIRLWGRDAIYILVLLASAAGILSMLFYYVENSLKYTRDQAALQAAEHKSVIEAVHQQDDLRSAEHDKIRRAIEKLSETMEEQNYIILLPNDKREKLRLDMPKSLREKIIRQQERER